MSRRASSRAAPSGTSSRAASPGTSSRAASPGTSSRAASAAASSRAASPGTSSRAASPGTSSRAASAAASSRTASPGTSSRAASAAASSRAGSPRGAETLRLFVALELPAPVRAALAAFCGEAAEPSIWRPVMEEALHLTLAFLGRRPAGDVAVVERVLHEAAGPAPRLALAGPVLLPPRRARVLCAALEDPDGTLVELQARVSEGLAAAGVYVPEKRPFRAHATVARLRPRERAPRTVSAAPEPIEFRGEALTLFESRLHPHGARYEPLVRIFLH